MSSSFSAGANGVAVSPIGSGPHPMRLARLRRYLPRAQWILASSLLAAIVVYLVTYAPRAKFFVSGNPSGQYEYVREYWWYAVTAETLVASTIGLLLGRWLIQLSARLKGNRSPLLPWYDSSVAVRDIAFIGFVLSGVYLTVMFLADGRTPGIAEGRIPYVGFISDTNPKWWLHRSWLFVGLSSAVVWLVGPRLSPGVLLPGGVSRSGQRGQIAFFYGLIIVFQTARPPFPPFLAFARSSVDTLLHAAPENRRGMAVLVFAVVFAALGAYLYLLREVVQAANRLPKPFTPIPIRLGMIGASESGKTVFLVRAYTLLSAYGNVSSQGLKLEPDRDFIDSPDATEFNSARRALEEGVKQPSGETKRIWPPGTTLMTRVPMTVSTAIKPVVRFEWTDLPGEAFTSDDMVFRMYFDEFLREADRFEAVVFIFNGELLHAAQEFRDLPYAARYEHAAREILRKQRDRGSDAHPIPMAIVITQVRKVAGPTDYLIRSRLKAKAQGFMNNIWQEGHAELELEAPSCRIFLTSAVSNAVHNTDPALDNTLPPVNVPLQSEETVEPLFFLAEHALRHNVTLIESVQGWTSGGASPLQRYVTWMRHASGA